MDEADSVALSHIDGLYLMPRLRNALTGAADLARTRGDRFMGTEHVLLGILGEPDSVVARVLKELGAADAAQGRLTDLMAAPGYARSGPVVAADPDLRRELLRRRDVDQAPRRWRRVGGQGEAGAAVVQAHIDLMRAIARENAAWLKGVIRDQGWPGQSLVCDDGSDAAWLLAQHADHDPGFQRECLDLLEVAVAEGQASQRNLVYLTDRVLLKERGHQRYGTQFTHGAGGPEPLPLEDPEHVDELRAGVGLKPLSDYRKRFTEMG